MTPQHIEEIGLVADSINNLLGALALPLPPQMHIEGLKPNLFSLMERLREVYVAEAGENPWL